MRGVWVGIDRLCGALGEGGGNQELQDTGNLGKPPAELEPQGTQGQSRGETQNGLAAGSQSLHSQGTLTEYQGAPE